MIDHPFSVLMAHITPCSVSIKGSEEGPAKAAKLYYPSKEGFTAVYIRQVKALPRVRKRDRIERPEYEDE